MLHRLVLRRLSGLAAPCLCLLLAISGVTAQEQCPAIQTVIRAGPPEECDRLAVGWLCIVTPGTVVNGYNGAFTYNDEDQDLGYTLPLYQTTWVEGAAVTPESDQWGMILAHLPLVEAEPGSIYRPSNPFANLIISGEFTLTEIMMVEPQLLTSLVLETGASDPTCDDSVLDGLILTVPQESEVALSLAINEVNLVVPPNGALFLAAPPDAAMTIQSLREAITVNNLPLPEGMTTTVLDGEATDPTEASEDFAFVALEALQPLRAVQPLDDAAPAVTVTPDTFGVGPLFDTLAAEAVTFLSITNNETGDVFAVARSEGSDWLLADSATAEIDLSAAQTILDHTLESLLELQHRSTFDTPFPDIFGLDPSYYLITLRTADNERILHIGDLTPGGGDARYVAFADDLMSVLVVAAVETFEEVLFPLADDPQAVLLGE